MDLFYKAIEDVIPTITKGKTVQAARQLRENIRKLTKEKSMTDKQKKSFYDYVSNKIQEMKVASIDSNFLLNLAQIIVPLPTDVMKSLKNQVCVSLNGGKRVILDSLKTYQQSMSHAIEEELHKFYGADLSKITLTDVIARNGEILKNPMIDSAIMDFDPELLYRFNPQKINPKLAVELLLEGKVIMEDTAAGEATRLGLGTKFTLDPTKIIEAIYTHPVLRALHTDEEAQKINTLTNKDKAKTIEIAHTLKPISIGARKLLKVSYDLSCIASLSGKDPLKVLEKQTKFIVINQATEDTILKQMLQYKFFGFNPENVYFITQVSMPGYRLFKGRVSIDQRSERMLHNHGALRMQQAMDHQFFRLKQNGQKEMMSFAKMSEVLQSKELMISSNIEDLDQLGITSLDLPSITLGYDFGQEGYEMIMMGVSQKKPPQAGGFFAYIPGEGLHCFESDQHPKLATKDPLALGSIKVLNKNVNMFPKPVRMFEGLRRSDLPIHPTVKGSLHKAIYPQTPQGDLNFILKTKFISEENPKPIRNLKTQHDLYLTVETMRHQDEDEDFQKWIKRFIP